MHLALRPVISKWCRSIEIVIQSLHGTLSVWRVWRWLKLEHGTKWMVQTLSSELEPKMWFNSGANTNSFWHTIPRINPISSSSLAWGEKVPHAMGKFKHKLVARKASAWCDMLSSILQWQPTNIWRWPMTKVSHDTLITWHTISMLAI